MIAVLGLVIAVSAVSSVLTEPAYAARTTREEQYLLMVGAGVAHPSVLHTPRDNPAIYSQNQHFKIQALGIVPSSQFNAGTAGFHLIAGNGVIGGQLGVEMGFPGASPIQFLGGVGVEIRPIRTAVGLQCQLGVSGSLTVSCSQLGFLINPAGGLRVGVLLGRAGVAFSTPFPVAAGMALSLGQYIVLALDAGTAFGAPSGANTLGFNLLPALGIRTPILDVNVGWGLPIVNSSGAGTSSAVPLGLVAGLGLRLGKRFYLSAGTNDAAWLWLQTTVRF